MRVRVDEKSNYKAVFFDNGKTIRMNIDPLKSIKTPQHPEIEDVAINSKCEAGCRYCYVSAVKSGSNFENIIDKAKEVWGSLEMNQRPFQIAIGGAGESTLHPQWIDFVKTVRELGILPNYTTNGMHLTDEILDATEKYCGGVAVSWHPHIEKFFHSSIEKYSKINTKLNTHIIVGDDKSVSDLKRLYEMYHDKIDYFVLLPYQAVGRAKTIDVHKNWIEVFKFIKTVDTSKFAFGALFYEWLKNNDVGIKIDVYEPEIYSGYRMMDDSYKMLRKSSYNLELK